MVFFSKKYIWKIDKITFIKGLEGLFFKFIIKNFCHWGDVKPENEVNKAISLSNTSKRTAVFSVKSKSSR